MGLLKLIFTLGVNNTPFRRDLNTAKGQALDFASNLKRTFAGAFTTAAVTTWLKSVGDATNRIKDLSEQFGITTGEVQKADFALKESGMAFEDLSTALSKLAASRREAVEGNEDLRRTFEKYGLTVRDLNDPQKRTFDILMQISRVMGEMNPTAREQTEIMDLLGAKAGKLVNVLGSLSQVKPPSIFSREDIERIDTLSKKLEQLKLSAQVATARGIGPNIDSMNRGLADLNKGNAGSGLLRIFQGLFMQTRGQVMGTARNLGIRTKAMAKDDQWADMMEAMLMTGIGPGMAPAGGLFTVDKNIAAAKGSSGFLRSSMASDQLVSVGNFLGQDPGVAVRSQIKEITSRLDKIEQNTKRTANGAIMIKK